MSSTDTTYLYSPNNQKILQEFLSQEKKPCHKSILIQSLLRNFDELSPFLSNHLIECDDCLSVAKHFQQEQLFMQKHFEIFHSKIVKLPEIKTQKVDNI